MYPSPTRDQLQAFTPRNPCISVNYWLIWPANEMMGKKNFKTVNLILYDHLITGRQKAVGYMIWKL